MSQLAMARDEVLVGSPASSQEFMIRPAFPVASDTTSKAVVALAKLFFAAMELVVAREMAREMAEGYRVMSADTLADAESSIHAQAEVVLRRVD